MSFTADDLLRFVKRRITVPASQLLLQDADMLEMADDVMRDTIVPLVLSTRQNFYVYTSTTTVTDGTATYNLPRRSIGRALRDVKYSTDGSLESQSMTSLVQYDLEDLHTFADTGTPSGCCFLGDKLQLVPAPDTSVGKIVWYYDLAPGKLIKLAQAALITGVAAPDVTVASVASLVTGASVDFAEGAWGISTRGVDAAVTNVAGTTISFAPGVVPPDLVAGDYLAPAGYSPVVQTPDEVYPLLCTVTAERILTALGDTEGLTNLRVDDAEQKKNAKMLLEPRLRGEPKKIINRAGLLRGRSGKTFGSRRMFT